MEVASTKEVLDFINHFKGASGTFLNGCCYWFAWILQERFHEREWLVDIFHDPVEGHFVARFISTIPSDTHVYLFDIRGDVTNLYSIDQLENVWLMQFTEERRWKNLMCDCRDFVEREIDAPEKVD